MSLAARQDDMVVTYQRRPARNDTGHLARTHMPLVRKIAWHVHGRVSSAIDLEDLIQIGRASCRERVSSVV